MFKKIVVLLLLLLLAGSFFYFDLHQLLTFAGLKQGLTEFSQWYQASPWLVAGGFFLFYVLVTALSLPGALILTVASGALFGLWQGLLLVSFASSIGATLAFLVARYMLRSTLQQKFSTRLKAIDQGIERDGAFYLFTLRLVPIFPFFLINILMGLTALKAGTFYWVSQVGMLAGTFVYVNAGTQIAQLDSLAGILSLNMLLSFALLGLFPWLAKGLIKLINQRRLYAKWQKPKQFDRNLIVIGAGAAGLVSSYIAAAVKAKVTLIEAHKMGGDCLNFGCVPSKALIKSAKVAHTLRHAEHYGLAATEPLADGQGMLAPFSFKKVMARIDQVIADIAPHDSVERYTNLGVEVLQGYGKLLDPWTVQITLADGRVQQLTARSIIIAAGAQPFVPPLPGLKELGYLTSDTLWQALAEREQPPAKLVILGGGPIGCELAQSFARLGSNVTQVEMTERVMIKEDREISDFAHNALTSSGVKLLTSHKALRCEIQSEQKCLIVEHQGQEIALPFDELICAVGRTARLDGYGLQELGIETARTVQTNDYLETLLPNIFAAGDIVGPYQFTHVAAHQAWYAAVNALFGQFKKFKVDYRVIPWTTFIDPEVARVGINEQEAKEQGIAYEVTRFDIGELDRAITDGAAHGLVKVLTKPGKDQILGVTIIAEHAGDLMAEFVLAMKHGLGLNKILGTIHSYPTWAEANKYAAGEWKRAHAPATILALLQKYHHWRLKG
ncbi:FAD-dependent oxidoreductase [Alishewanella sp. HL-SH06]|uniref:FAD-dependent oxidoreductase n=1 Tax=Alishewanella sp. HL-SH06 TaxID=3461144 RepID=UPI0040433B60